MNVTVIIVYMQKILIEGICRMHFENLVSLCILPEVRVLQECVISRM